MERVTAKLTGQLANFGDLWQKVADSLSVTRRTLISGISLCLPATESRERYGI